MTIIFLCRKLRRLSLKFISCLFFQLVIILRKGLFSTYRKGCRQRVILDNCLGFNSISTCLICSGLLWSISKNHLLSKDRIMFSVFKSTCQLFSWFPILLWEKQQDWQASFFHLQVENGHVRDWFYWEQCQVYLKLRWFWDGWKITVHLDEVLWRYFLIAL